MLATKPDLALLVLFRLGAPTWGLQDSRSSELVTSGH